MCVCTYETWDFCVSEREIWMYRASMSSLLLRWPFYQQFDSAKMAHLWTESVKEFVSNLRAYMWNFSLLCIRVSDWNVLSIQEKPAVKMAHLSTVGPILDGTSSSWTCIRVCEWCTCVHVKLQLQGCVSERAIGMYRAFRTSLLFRWHIFHL